MRTSRRTLRSIIAIPDNSNFYIGKEQFPLDALGEKIKSA